MIKRKEEQHSLPMSVPVSAPNSYAFGNSQLHNQNANHDGSGFSSNGIGISHSVPQQGMVGFVTNNNQHSHQSAAVDGLSDNYNMLASTFTNTSLASDTGSPINTSFYQPYSFQNNITSHFVEDGELNNERSALGCSLSTISPIAPPFLDQQMEETDSQTNMNTPKTASMISHSSPALMNERHQQHNHNRASEMNLDSSSHSSVFDDIDLINDFALDKSGNASINSSAMDVNNGVGVGGNSNLVRHTVSGLKRENSNSRPIKAPIPLHNSNSAAAVDTDKSNQNKKSRSSLMETSEEDLNNNNNIKKVTADSSSNTCIGRTRGSSINATSSNNNNNSNSNSNINSNTMNGGLSGANSFKKLGSNSSLSGSKSGIDEKMDKKEAKLEKNRQSARDCRRRKKEYIKGLETKVDSYSQLNKLLKDKLGELEQNNFLLMKELRELKDYIANGGQVMNGNYPNMQPTNEYTYWNHN